MKYNWVEVITGLAVLVLAFYFGFMAVRAVGFYNTKPSYPLYAEFVSAEGVSSGGEIRMAGVRIGRIGEMSLNRENFTADVELLIDDGVTIPADSEVKISADGLIGSAYLEVVPGADIVMLNSGEQFVYASSSVSLMGLLSKFISNAGK